MIEVRRARDAADRAAAFAVRHEVFVVGQGVPVDIERDDRDDDADHLLALLDGYPVGTGRLVVDGDVGVLGRLAVLDAARGRGLGVALVAAIEEEARRRGLRAVELHAQTHALAFYERLGYAAYGEEYLEAGIPHVSMRKALGATASRHAGTA